LVERQNPDSRDPENDFCPFIQQNIYAASIAAILAMMKSFLMRHQHRRLVLRSGICRVRLNDKGPTVNGPIARAIGVAMVSLSMELLPLSGHTYCVSRMIYDPRLSRVRRSVLYNSETQNWQTTFNNEVQHINLGFPGIGLLRKPFLSMNLDAQQIELFKKLETAFDPRNILNPGKIFDL
jgi:hypothetical protein